MATCFLAFTGEEITTGAEGGNQMFIHMLIGSNANWSTDISFEDWLSYEIMT